jgi:hypothetical protein
MYGLEKKKEVPPFEFDLEKDIRESAEKMKAIEKKIAERATELKNLLRHGSAQEEFEQLGILLHAYSVLPRILNRIKAKKA